MLASGSMKSQYTDIAEMAKSVEPECQEAVYK